MVNAISSSMISPKLPKNAVVIWYEIVQGITLATANCHLTVMQDNHTFKQTSAM